MALCGGSARVSVMARRTKMATMPLPMAWASQRERSDGIVRTEMILPTGWMSAGLGKVGQRTSGAHDTHRETRYVSGVGAKCVAGGKCQ